ncbi:hypothetical protein ABES38_11895 [Bacillus gobiensis]
MKIQIIEGPHADKCINACYNYILKLYRKVMERQVEDKNQNDPDKD